MSIRTLLNTTAALLATAALALGVAPTAQAATGGDFLTIHNDSVMLHVNSGGAVDVSASIGEGDWLCYADSSSPDELYAYADYSISQIYLSAFSAGKYSVIWKVCNDSVLPVNHVLTVYAKNVKKIHVRHVRKTHAGKHVYSASNPNAPVLWSDDQTVALDNDGMCSYGSFEQPSPEGTFALAAGGTKSFRSAYGAKHLDVICYATQDGTLMLLRDSSSSKISARKVPVSGFTAWGKTFGKAFVAQVG